MTKELEESVQTLIQALKDDPEYYYSWQANIAMAFKETYGNHIGYDDNFEKVHEAANTAAKNFLNLLIK